MNLGVTNGNCGRAGNEGSVTWKLENGRLTISGNGYMADRGADSDIADVPWYDQREYIRSIVIESGVESIGSNMFRGCSSIKSIDIPESVTSIGACAFEDCTSLENVTITDSVKSIGERAFYGCFSLINIKVLGDDADIAPPVFCRKIGRKSDLESMLDDFRTQVHIR